MGTGHSSSGSKPQGAIVMRAGGLDTHARQREAVGRALGQPAHLPERMEGDDERDPEYLLEVLRDHARHEKVGVHDVVQGRLAAREAGDEAREGLHVGQHLFLRHVMRRARGYVHDARVVGQPDQLLLADGIAAREDVDQVAGQRQLAREVRHVHVLAAAVDAAGRRQRRGVVADQRDAA
jgi:hypothetical protein